MGGKNKGPQLVGAKEKIMKAKMLKHGRLADHIETKGEGKKPAGPTVVLIYILAAGLAYVLQIGAMKNNGLPWHTGMTGFDNLMFSSGVPSITGDSAEDEFVVPLLRGLIIFLAAGFLPLLTLLWIRAIDRPNMNPFLAFWGVSVGFFFVFFFTRDFFGPLLMQTLDIMSGPG
jgi:hypothetical protein